MESMVFKPENGSPSGVTVTIRGHTGNIGGGGAGNVLCLDLGAGYTGKSTELCTYNLCTFLNLCYIQQYISIK